MGVTDTRIKLAKEKKTREREEERGREEEGVVDRDEKEGGGLRTQSETSLEGDACKLRRR